MPIVSAIKRKFTKTSNQSEITGENSEPAESIETTSETVETSTPVDQ